MCSALADGTIYLRLLDGIQANYFERARGVFEKENAFFNRDAARRAEGGSVGKRGEAKSLGV